MGIADRVKAKYLTRIDELIVVGTTMPMKQHSSTTRINIISGRSNYRHYERASLPEFVEWRTSCIAVLDQVVPQSSLLRKTVDRLDKLTNEPTKVEFVVSFLRSVKKELEAGSLDSLAGQIETAVLSDYLEQAMVTLAGSKDEPNHIAAAVIAGAALERSLRSICSSLSPEEPVTSEKGVRLRIATIIDALKKRRVFNEIQSKQVHGWTALRNYAAHGDFEEFNRQQVEAMVAGIESFVAEHAK